jgi:hypothetical protein
VPPSPFYSPSKQPMLKHCLLLLRLLRLLRLLLENA